MNIVDQSSFPLFLPPPTCIMQFIPTAVIYLILIIQSDRGTLSRSVVNGKAWLKELILHCVSQSRTRSFTFSEYWVCFFVELYYTMRPKLWCKRKGRFLCKRKYKINIERFFALTHRIRAFLNKWIRNTGYY